MTKLVRNESVKKPDKSIECFSPTDFTTPHYLSHSDDTPMWWKVKETPSLTYSEYKKNKKRKARQIKQLEAYLTALGEERRRHSERLRDEEERYGEELKVKDEAYEARAKQYELELRIEAEEREKKLLEELENARARAREEALLREVERTRRLDEERQFKAEQRRKSAEAKAQIEKERLEAEAEAERIKAEIEAEKERKKAERRQESARIKDIKLEEERRIAEEQNAERLRKAREEAERERALQAQLDEELRLEKERVQAEIAERERVRLEHEKEEARTRMEAERIEALKTETEKKTIAQLRRAHKLRDVEFSYPQVDISDGEECVIVGKGLCLKSKSGNLESKQFDFSATYGLTVKYGLSSSDVYDLSTIFTRSFDGSLMSGGLRVGGLNAHKLRRRDYVEALEDIAYVVPYDVEDKLPCGKIVKYVQNKVGVERLDEVRRALNVLGENAVEVLNSTFSGVSLSVGVKVMLSCALATTKKAVVLFEPKRTLDMPSANAFKSLLEEWSKSDKEVALLIFTGDKAGAK